MADLFDGVAIGGVNLRNRILMAPMTRGRAGPDGAPTRAMAEYYAMRAEAGLIVTEGVCVSPRALGWVGAPSIYTPDQLNGWRTVVDAVHSKGGRIYAQLWFVGRVSHPVFLSGDRPWAPSAIRPDQHVHAPSGERLDCETPHEMSRQDIRVAIEDFAKGAKNAMDVGFDGVQVHGANGYIIDQFLRDGANQRSDEYGGSIANRLKFMMETVAACCDVAGEGRVAVRLSPLNPYNDMRDSNPAALFAQAAAALNNFPLSFLEIVEGPPGHFLHAPGGPVLPEIRRRYQGVLIANGGYQFENAAAAVEAGDVDGVSFGVPFISNPDLVDRFRRDRPLAAPDAETFYTAGEKGYLDYPTYDEKPESGAAYRGLQLEDARKH